MWFISLVVVYQETENKRVTGRTIENKNISVKNETQVIEKKKAFLNPISFKTKLGEDRKLLFLVSLLHVKAYKF